MKPIRLYIRQVDDSQWAPGDQARVVGLHDGSGGEELQKFRGSIGSWNPRDLVHLGSGKSQESETNRVVPPTS